MVHLQTDLFGRGNEPKNFGSCIIFMLQRLVFGSVVLWCRISSNNMEVYHISGCILHNTILTRIQQIRYMQISKYQINYSIVLYQYLLPSELVFCQMNCPIKPVFPWYSMQPFLSHTLISPETLETGLKCMILSQILNVQPVYLHLGSFVDKCRYSTYTVH